MTMDFKSIILTELGEIYNSDRWSDQDNPLRQHIPELWERIDDSAKYKQLRKNKDLSLLLEITEVLEESFNNDWLPYEFFGMKLVDVKIFLRDLLDKLPSIADSNITQTIKMSRKNIIKN